MTNRILNICRSLLLISIPALAVAPAMADMTFSPAELAELNDGFVVAIELDAMAGAEDAVGEALTALVKPTMAEPGVKLFLPYRSPKNPKAFFIFELYKSEADWAEHQKTDHFKAFVEKTVPRLARRERVPFVPFVPNTSAKLTKQ